MLECVGIKFIRVEPLTNPEGDFPILPRTSHRLTQKLRTRSQVSRTLYPSNVGQNYSQDVQSLTTPATLSYHGSAKS